MTSLDGEAIMPRFSLRTLIVVVVVMLGGPVGCHQPVSSSPAKQPPTGQPSKPVAAAKMPKISAVKYKNDSQVKFKDTEVTWAGCDFDFGAGVLSPGNTKTMIEPIQRRQPRLAFPVIVRLKDESGWAETKHSAKGPIPEGAVIHITIRSRDDIDVQFMPPESY